MGYVEEQGHSAPPVRYDVCSVCEKSAERHTERFAPFVVAIARGTAINPKTGIPEPIVRDGMFDANGKLALLKACPNCAPKVLRFLDQKSTMHLPNGRFKDLCKQIEARQRLEGLRIH